MAQHEYLLPDELGWQTNDAISEAIEAKLNKLGELAEKAAIHGNTQEGFFLLKVTIAEIMDDTYAKIKARQKELGLLQ